MTYTPPPGFAVDFNFKAPGYSPPPGGQVLFFFGYTQPTFDWSTSWAIPIGGQTLNSVAYDYVNDVLAVIYANETIILLPNVPRFTSSEINRRADKEDYVLYLVALLS